MDSERIPAKNHFGTSPIRKNLMLREGIIECEQAGL